MRAAIEKAARGAVELRFLWQWATGRLETWR